MIKKIERYFRHSDDRGGIDGLVNFGEWREINMISSVRGTIRGNHFHRETHELFVILDGKIEVSCQRVNGSALVGSVEHYIFGVGDVFVIEPYTNHVFKIQENARWLNALSSTMDPKSPDLHRPQ